MTAPAQPYEPQETPPLHDRIAAMLALLEAMPGVRDPWCNDLWQLLAEADTALAECEQERATQEEYIKYLCEADAMTGGYLAVHNWQYPPEFLKRGDEIRTRLAKRKT